MENVKKNLSKATNSNWKISPIYFLFLKTMFNSNILKWGCKFDVSGEIQSKSDGFRYHSKKMYGRWKNTSSINALWCMLHMYIK